MGRRGLLLLLPLLLLLDSMFTGGMVDNAGLDLGLEDAVVDGVAVDEAGFECSRESERAEAEGPEAILEIGGKFGVFDREEEAELLADPLEDFLEVAVLVTTEEGEAASLEEAARLLDAAAVVVSLKSTLLLLLELSTSRRLDLVLIITE